MTSPLDQEWPAEDLERVNECPYCGSQERILAYKDAQDWSFHCAPGKWTYWDCVGCQSLYLDPRPTRGSIGAAYANYYTHGTGEPAFFLQTMKARLRNECLSQKLATSIEPRLHLPGALNGVVELVGKRVSVPFGWTSLVNRPKGRFLDVGCGSGLMVALAQQLGWDAMGLEIDPAAVQAAQKIGLNIVEGTYEQLSQYKQQFDCVMCSHVLEHVHDPLDLLLKLRVAIRPGGVLLLALPNSLSALRRHFGINWRGLEAPRHLSIPSDSWLMELLVKFGFSVKSMADEQLATAVESYRIQRRGLVISRRDISMARKLKIQPSALEFGNDFIRFVCDVPVNISD